MFYMFLYNYFLHLHFVFNMQYRSLCIYFIASHGIVLCEYKCTYLRIRVSVKDNKS